MHIRPILSTLRRHRTAATLIVLEIAVTCAIICNAVFIIGERLGRMNRETGIAEDELIRVQVAGIGRNANPEVLTTEDLAALAAIPGVRKAAVTNQVPFGNSSWNSSVKLDPEQKLQNFNAATYLGTDDLLETLGVRLIAGRDFTPAEFVDWKELDVADSKAKLTAIIISKAAAERLFPGQNALGKALYIWGETEEDGHRVVGIVDRLVRPNEQGGPGDVELSVILPVRLPYTMGGNYILRVDPERRTEVLAAAVTALERNSPNRIVLEKQVFSDIRAEYFRQDKAMAWLLVSVCIALLVITALGIVGLASFWVQQRRRQIGIRRALGATRRQILRYFQTENFLLATLGIVLGMAMAYGINMLLMEKYELARLPAGFLPLGAVILWVLGQLAVLGPAMRAAAVPPAVATRTV
jgi:putative ABC transport system permease protein